MSRNSIISLYARFLEVPTCSRTDQSNVDLSRQCALTVFAREKYRTLPSVSFAPNKYDTKLKSCSLGLGYSFSFMGLCPVIEGKGVKALDI